MTEAPPKIIIAGPGRSGTTLLVELLTRLGLHTNAGELVYFDSAHAGLEVSNPLSPDAPAVIKWPGFTQLLPRLLESGRMHPDQIGHVLIPLRELEAAAASRVKVSADEGIFKTAGGMVGTVNPRRQAAVLAVSVYGLVATLAEYEIPFTVIAFPRFALDPDYAYRHLGFLSPDRTEAEFKLALSETVQPELIHTSGAEQWRTNRTLSLFVRAGLGRARRSISRTPQGE